MAMKSSTLTRIRNFVILALIQVLIFSHIHLFGYATAYIYLIFLLKLPRLALRSELLVWAFCFGLVVDMFSDTPGINTCAATAMAFIRNYILVAFTQKGNTDDFTPSVQTIGWSGYTAYVSICLSVFYMILYFLELFTINYPVTLLIGVVGSTLLTLFLTMVAECFASKK